MVANVVRCYLVNGNPFLETPPMDIENGATLPPSIMEQLDDLAGEIAANEVRSERRARYWLTNLAVVARATKLREYVGKINAADIKFLKTAPNVNDAISNLHALSRELKELAWKLSTNDELRCDGR
jgi:hypothetical protein